VQRCDAAQAALQTFSAELTAAETKRGEAYAAVRTAALAVVAAIIDDQVETLRQQQVEVVQQRRRLQALASWWPDASGPMKLSASSVQVLSTVPDFDLPGVRGIDNSAPKVWTDLLAALIDGDAEATYPPSALAASPPTVEAA
jgi:hypothetical protein